jgi:hypothetical protein
MNGFPADMKRLPSELALDRIRALSLPGLQGFLSRLRRLRVTDDTACIVFDTLYAVEQEICARCRKRTDAA